MRTIVSSIAPLVRVQKSSQVGGVVAAGRKARGKSQQAFATELGVSRKTLSDFERGEGQNISLQTALRALSLAGLVVSIQEHRPPTLTEVLEAKAVRRNAASPTEHQVR
jgi:transcriptional regulator with XRE-family HTH domain